MYNYKAFLQGLENLKTREDTTYSDVLDQFVPYLQMVLNDIIFYNKRFMIEYRIFSRGPALILNTKHNHYHYIMFEYNFYGEHYQKRLLEYKTNFFIGV